MRRIVWIVLLLLLCAAGCGDTHLSSKERVLPETEAVTEYREELDIIPEKTQRIVCWGDSLTFGEGGDGVTFPLVLGEKTGLEVINYGVQGETAEQIGLRMGAFSMRVGSFEIPQEAVPVEVSLQYLGEDPVMMRLGDSGINPCRIAGIEGTLTYDASDDHYYFTRLQEGNALEVAEGEPIETFASGDRRESDIIILFAGTNRAPDIGAVGELIDAEKQMLDYLGTERYLVIGLTSLALVPDAEPINEALTEEFGAHFLDIRTYLLEHGLEDAGIEPTGQDRADLATGEIPSSLRVDIVHGNEAFYRIIGEQVFLKLKEIGYLLEENGK